MVFYSKSKTLNLFHEKIIIVLSIFIIQCDIVSNQDTINTKAQTINITDTRLHFENRAEIIKKIDEFKNLENEESEKRFVDLYENGFIPMKPNLSDDNLDLMEKLLNKGKLNFKAYRKNSSDYEENIDDFEEIIGDDEYASFINNNGEIQVADSIYKYTDVGLYFVHESQISYLNDYLETAEVQNKIKLNNSNCNNELYEQPGVQEIDEHISYFSDPAPCDPYSGSGTAPPTSPSPELTAEEFILGLPNCNPSGSNLGGIFGKSFSCADKFSSDFRIKTKYWNQNYYLYRGIGVAVKHQKKKFWIWWSIKTDELRLGINQAYFEYDAFVPNFFSQISNDLIFFEGNAYNSFGALLGSTFQTTPLEFPILAEITLQVRLSDYEVYDVNVQDVFSLTQEILLPMARTFLANKNRPAPKSLLVLGVVKDKIVYNYLNTSVIKQDAKNARKIFDWQAGIGVKLGIGGNGISFQGITAPNFYDYDKILIDIYGVGKRNSTWKGNRLKYSAE